MWKREVHYGPGQCNGQTGRALPRVRLGRANQTKPTTAGLGWSQDTHTDAYSSRLIFLAAGAAAVLLLSRMRMRIQSNLLHSIDQQYPTVTPTLFHLARPDTMECAAS